MVNKRKVVGTVFAISILWTAVNGAKEVGTSNELFWHMEEVLLMRYL
jgi:hypothetical protein